MVADGVDEDLRLSLQPPERLGVDDAVAIALERRPQIALLLRPEPPARLVRARGQRRQPLLLLLADACLERLPDRAGGGHQASVLCVAAGIVTEFRASLLSAGRTARR